MTDPEPTPSDAPIAPEAQSAATVLVVDDEVEVRRLLRRGLEQEGYRVLEANSRTGLFHVLSAHPIDLITLDIGLGAQDGLELAREVRATRNVPVILITGRSDPLDRVIGLEYGADDYITKPFHIREVILRLRSTLARYSTNVTTSLSHEAQAFRFDGFRLDAGAREIHSRDGRRVNLTETEYRLTELFVRNPGRVLSRDEIWRTLRGHDCDPFDRTLDGHVARLRAKIEPASEDEPRMIKSVRGVGYVFTGAAEPLG